MSTNDVGLIEGQPVENLDRILEGLRAERIEATTAGDKESVTAIDEQIAFYEKAPRPVYSDDNDTGNRVIVGVTTANVGALAR